MSAASLTLGNAVRGARRIAAPLAHRDFRLLWLGQAVSNFGDPIQTVALAWLVLDRTGSAVALSGALLAVTIPRALLTVLGGALADRVGPRQILLWSDAVRAGAVAGLALLALVEPFPFWAVFGVLVVYGAAGGLFAPSVNSITPRLVPEDDLQAAVSLRETTPQVGMLVGSPVAGALVAVAGPAVALALNAGSFAIATLATLAMRADQPLAPPADGATEPEGPVPLLAATAEGLAYVRRHTWLAALLAVEFACSLISGGTIMVGLPLLARGPLQAGPEGYGLLVSAIGAGHIVGMLALAGGRTLRHRGWVYGLLVMAQAPLFAALAIASLPATLLLLAASGVVNGVVLVMFLTLLQTRVDRALLGRVMGIVSLAFYGLSPLSQAVAGPVADAAGPGPLFVLAGAVFLAAGVGGLLVPALRSID